MSMAALTNNASTTEQKYVVPKVLAQWVEAYGKYVEATVVYNNRVIAIKEREKKFPSEFGKDNSFAEEREMEKYKREALTLLKPMFDALNGKVVIEDESTTKSS